MTLMYNEAAILGTLRQLSPLFRSVYATAAATRLLPAFSHLMMEKSAYVDATLAQVIDQLWTDLERPDISEMRLDPLLDQCMSLLPEETQDWSSDRPYAEDAVSSAVYAIRSRLTGSPQEAVWAGRRVYEALDQYAINDSGVSFDQPDSEMRLATHPWVQVELRHQQEDLADLVTAQQLEASRVVQRLRERASASAYRFLSPSAP